MVTIRYAGTLTGYHQRFVGWDTNQIACQIISEAIEATSAKYDNNIKANRFDAVRVTYEVTLKCKSSRGKGAKITPQGRHLISCCWHVWGTFFEELFKLNPAIKIRAMGSVITACSHVGWRENETDSVQCDCNGEAHEAWIDEQNEVSQSIMQAETIPTEEELEEIPEPRCADCVRASHRGNGLCTESNRCLVNNRHLRFERWVATPPRTHRDCDTCRYNSINTRSRNSECPPGRCLEHEGLQLWAPNVNTPPVLVEPNPELRDCSTCAHSEVYNRRPGYSCYNAVGACGNGNPKWAPRITTLVVNGRPESRYDIPVGVEQTGQLELHPVVFWKLTEGDE